MTRETVLLDPQLSAFATNNDALPESLIPACLAGLEKADRALRSLDEAVSGHEDEEKLSALKEQRQGVALKKDALLSLLSPCRRLPNELIARIIQATLAEPAMLDEDDRMLFERLRLVCRRWRDVALSTPELWRGLEVRLNERGHLYWTLEAFTTWFRRGGEGALLRLFVVEIEPFAENGHPLTSLLRLFPNWVELTLILQWPTLRALLETPSQASNLQFPSLRHLDLFFTRDDNETWIHNLGTESFPRLESLYLEDGDALSSRFRLLSFNNPSITSLHLKGWKASGRELASALSYESLPALQELVLEALHGRERDDSHPTSVLHSNPTVARLVMIGSTTGLSLSHLTFPSLQYLRLAAICTFDNHDREEAITSFLRRSTSCLDTLSVEDSLLHGSTIISRVIGAVSTVRRLHVRDLEALISLVSTAQPNLKSLEVVVCRDPFYGAYKPKYPADQLRIVDFFCPNCSPEFKIFSTVPLDLVQEMGLAQILQGDGIIVDDGAMVFPMRAHWYHHDSFEDVAVNEDQYKH